MDMGCGCNTDSVWLTTYYYNLNGYSDYNAILYYDTSFKRNSWFIGVTFPNSIYTLTLKICNPNLPGIKAITDTITRQNGIPVRGIKVVFSGKLKKLCLNESPCFGCTGGFFPEGIRSYITVDSLIKN